MIAKILRKSSSFSGIDYNERRVKKGEAELLCRENFGDTEALLKTPSSCKTFLEEWSARNDRTKYPQLHVSISAKGKDMSKEELLQAGKDWLREMGYGDNPYIIYFHNNTDNNHIHIITTRINRQGLKIDDSFEKKRSLQIIDQLSKTNRHEEIRQLVADRLKFSFTNKKQFFLLLERAGCSVKETGDNKTTIQKAGGKLTISNDLIMFCQKRYWRELEKEEKKKIKALVIKYSIEMKKEDFRSFMKEKFGYDFFFFGDQGNPYGYAMVDNRNRRVLQGKDILPVKILLGNYNKAAGRAEYFNSIIRHLLEENPYATRGEINKILHKAGGYIDKDSVRKKWRGKIKICDLDKNLKEKIAYNNKRDYVLNKYKPNSIAELLYINKKTGLNLVPGDMKKIKKNPEDISYYTQFMREILNSENPIERLRENNFSINSIAGELVFINHINKNRTVMFTNNDIGLSKEEITSSLYANDTRNETIYEKEESGNLSIDDALSELIEGIDYIIPDEVGGVEGDDPTKKKKKKKGEYVSR